MEEANKKNDNFSAEIVDLKKRKEELEFTLNQQSVDFEQLKRTHQQALSENSETIRNLKVIIDSYSSRNMHYT